MRVVFRSWALIPPSRYILEKAYTHSTAGCRLCSKMFAPRGARCTPPQRQRNHVSSQTHNQDSHPKSFVPCLLDDESVIGLAGRVARHEHAVGEPHHSQERDSPRHFAFLPSPALLFPFFAFALFFAVLGCLRNCSSSSRKHRQEHTHAMQRLHWRCRKLFTDSPEGIRSDVVVQGLRRIEIGWMFLALCYGSRAVYERVEIEGDRDVDFLERCLKISRRSCYDNARFGRVSPKNCCPRKKSKIEKHDLRNFFFGCSSRFMDSCRLVRSFPVDYVCIWIPILTTAAPPPAHPTVYWESRPPVPASNACNSYINTRCKKSVTCMSRRSSSTGGRTL